MSLPFIIGTQGKTFTKEDPNIIINIQEDILELYGITQWLVLSSCFYFFSLQDGRDKFVLFRDGKTNRWICENGTFCSICCDELQKWMVDGSLFDNMSSETEYVFQTNGVSFNEEENLSMIWEKIICCVFKRNWVQN